MRTRPVVAALAALSVMLPAAAFAQRAGAIEIGGFGRYTFQPDTLLVENTPAGGGRIGWFIFRNLSVEGEVSFGVSDSKVVNIPDSIRDVSHTLWQARLLYNTPRAARTSFMLGVGGVYDGFGRLRVNPARGRGVSGLAGLRFYLTDRVTARLEGNGYYVFEDKDAKPNGRPDTFTPSVQAGVSILFRNAPPAVVAPVVVTRTDTVTVRTITVDTVFRDRMAAASNNSGGMMGRGATVVIGAVNFDFDKAELSSDARRILDDIATSLARPEASNLTLILTGNTDAIGGESYNNRLSERRAASVAEYLQGKGLAAGRLQQRAAGEGNPVASNTNPEGRATNRRVLIELQNGAP